MKLVRLINTVKYLKFKQIYYRLFYFGRNRFRKAVGFKYDYSKSSNPIFLKLIDSIDSNSKYADKNFDLLNLSKTFQNEIDWNYNEFGKLWTYNLTYFEYLNKEEDKALIYDFIENIETVKDGLEPFPISLRGISWIKFLVKHKIKEKMIDDSLYAQYYILMDNLEYHLLGNHLLENGFSLLFGAYYFEDEKLYKKAKEILEIELSEQILNDGAHFELSPMYHQIMLFRVLDCINLVKNNSWKNSELLDLLEDKAVIMLGWLENITYKNGNIPLLNDSATKIAPTSNELFDYANRLHLKTNRLKLKESGYRKINRENYESIIDIGSIGPSYIPGHAHADTFNFELYINEAPFIVDTGLSTYNTGGTRDSERSTNAHNTVEVNGDNSSEVWGGFRVADRANVNRLIDKKANIKALHNGYNKKYSVMHTREWKFEDSKVIIFDTLDKECESIARLHFHPDINEDEIKSRIKTKKYELKYYNYAPEFNKVYKSLVLEIPFKKELKVEIEI